MVLYALVAEVHKGTKCCLQFYAQWLSAVPQHKKSGQCHAQPRVWHVCYFDQAFYLCTATTPLQPVISQTTNNYGT